MTSLEMKYIGAVALLGRVSQNYKLRDDEETLGCIESAMKDLLLELPNRFEIWKTTSGWSLEPSREDFPIV